jgi:predicted nucleic acid-binding protein
MSPEDVPEGPLLIDTDVVSYWVVDAPQAQRFSALVAGHELALSFGTYGELLANAHARRWGESRIESLRRRLRGFVVVPYVVQTVELWAKMHAKLSDQLHKVGQMISGQPPAHSP